MKKSNFLFPALLTGLMLCDPALAAAGTQSINTLFQTILTTLQGVSLVVVTIALVWAGYKIIFTSATLLGRRLSGCRSLAGRFAGGLNGNVKPAV